MEKINRSVQFDDSSYDKSGKLRKKNVATLRRHHNLTQITAAVLSNIASET